jgi:hypothetical protein
MLTLCRRTREGGGVNEGDASHRGTEKREIGEGGVLIYYIYALILTSFL